jgi:hypothetical protein
VLDLDYQYLQALQRYNRKCEAQEDELHGGSMYFRRFIYVTCGIAITPLFYLPVTTAQGSRFFKVGDFIGFVSPLQWHIAPDLYVSSFLS